MIDRGRGDNPINALDRRVSVFDELRNRRVIDFPVESRDKRVQVLAESLDVDLVQVRQKRLRVGNDLAGKTRRRRDVGIFWRPGKLQWRMLRRVEQVDGEILLARDAGE